MKSESCSESSANSSIGHSQVYYSSIGVLQARIHASPKNSSSSCSMRLHWRSRQNYRRGGWNNKNYGQ